MSKQDYYKVQKLNKQFNEAMKNKNIELAKKIHNTICAITGLEELSM